MPATRATLNAVLQNYYRGPVNDQLNQQAMALALFKKGQFTFSGTQAVVPVHLSRNTGVGVAAESAALPVAGQQGYAALNVPACYVYGRFQITGPAMHSAKAGVASFVGGLRSEMDCLVDDLTQLMNQFTVYGNQNKGYIHELAALTPTVAAQVAGGLAGDGVTATYDYCGDFTPFLNCVTGTEATWVRILLDFTDTGLPVTETGVVPNVNPNIMVRSVTQATGQMQIIYLTDAAGGDGINPAAIANPNKCMAVRLHTVRAVDSAAAAFGVDPAVAYPNLLIEPSGIFTNLSNPTHFGVVRTFGAAGYPLLCQVERMDTALPGTFAALTLPRLEGMDATVEMAVGKHIDTYMMSPLQRQRYMALLIGVITVDGSKATKGDGGFTSYEFAGKRIVTDKDVPNGMIIGLNMNTWKRAEMKKGDFVDDDGAILSRVANTDAMEGFWSAYYNLVSVKPAGNLILTGINL